MIYHQARKQRIIEIVFTSVLLIIVVFSIVGKLITQEQLEGWENYTTWLVLSFIALSVNLFIIQYFVKMARYLMNILGA